MEDLLKLAKKGKLDALESAWLEAAEDESADLDHMLAAAETLAQRGHADLAESLLWYLIDALDETGDLRRALRTAREGAYLLPGSDLLRELLRDLYARHLADRPGAESVVAATLGADEAPLDEALQRLEKLLAMEPGSYVLDPRRNEAGRVLGFDAEEGALEVAFREEEKAYAPAIAARLEPVGPDDFRALATFEAERLQQLAEEDPEELVRLALTSLDRRMKLRRLRIYLEPVVGSWRRWWTGARDTLRRSALIGLTQGDSPAVFLRREPLSHQQRLLERFKRAGDAVEKLVAALDILAETRREAPEAGLPGQVIEELAELAEGSGPASGVELAAAAALQAFQREFPDLSSFSPPVPEPLEEGDAERLLETTREPRVLSCVLEFLRRRTPEGWAVFLSTLLPRAPREICGKVAKALSEAGESEALAEACGQVLSAQEVSAGAVSWLWRECAGARPGPLCEGVQPVSVLFRLLSTAASVVRRSDISEVERKRQIAQIRSALFMRDGEPLACVLGNAPEERLAAVQSAADRNAALTGHMQARFTLILRRVAPGLFVEEVPPWEEDTIYTTPSGLERRREELERLVNERLPRVIKEIGEAASFGDISDNAEYQSAVRERGRLADLAERMREEISRARPITREVAEADHVTVGSRVRAENLETGEVEELVFLGPWDAEVREKVYAYNAPLGRAFMGKEPGDTVSLERGARLRRWKILAVEPAVE